MDEDPVWLLSRSLAVWLPGGSGGGDGGTIVAQRLMTVDSNQWESGNWPIVRVYTFVATFASDERPFGICSPVWRIPFAKQMPATQVRDELHFSVHEASKMHDFGAQERAG